MQIKNQALLLTSLLLSGQALAASSLSGGVWLNYRYVEDDDRDEDTLGDVADEALVIYASGEADEGQGNWSYGAELRVGPGSFTDRDNNSSGDNTALHEAWVAFALNPQQKVIVGKSQVPFGWKTVNFWPGDMFQAGFGDQMDVGVVLDTDQQAFDYKLAYFHADDFGETSTDSVDDNGHWGSSTTYRKIKTFVADANYQLAPHHTIGVSVMSGKLQELITPENDTDGKHSAWVLYYKAKFDHFYANAEYISTSRTLPSAYVPVAGVEEIENDRIALEFGYAIDKWNFYLDVTHASTDTDGNTSDDILAWAPGFTYNYGPGWIYAEYLNQDGYIDRDGRMFEGDFSAFYLTVDFYFD